MNNGHLSEVTLEPKSPIIKHDLTNSILITCKYFGLKEPDEVKWYKVCSNISRKGNVSYFYTQEHGETIYLT